MPQSNTAHEPCATEAGLFTTTHWSVVLTAGQAESPRAQEALSKLCQTYWYPLYAYVRRQGHNPHDAQDLTQEFFARLLQSHYFAAADPRRGRFRSFLLGTLKHFLAHEWQKGQALKRGGGRGLISLDAHTGESRYALEPAENATADKIFERRWALTLLEQVLVRLRQEYEESGKLRLFEALKPALTGDKSSASYAEIGARLGMNEGAVKVTVHRLRQRYGALLREEIAHTVASPAEVEEELRHLLSVLSP